MWAAEAKERKELASRGAAQFALYNMKLALRLWKSDAMWDRIEKQVMRAARTTDGPLPVARAARLARSTCPC